LKIWGGGRRGKHVTALVCSSQGVGHEGKNGGRGRTERIVSLQTAAGRPPPLGRKTLHKLHGCLSFLKWSQGKKESRHSLKTCQVHRASPPGRGSDENGVCCGSLKAIVLFSPPTGEKGRRLHHEKLRGQSQRGISQKTAQSHRGASSIKNKTLVKFPPDTSQKSSSLFRKEKTEAGKKDGNKRLSLDALLSKTALARHCLTPWGGGSRL